MKTYKVWHWEDGIEKIMYQGTHYGRARLSYKLWSRSIPNLEKNFEL